MRYTVPSVSEVDQNFGLYAQKQAVASSGWTQAAPRGPDKRMLLAAQLRQAVAVYHSTPKRKAFLPNLVMALDQAQSAVKRLLAEFPLHAEETIDTLRKAYFSSNLSEDKSRRYHLLDWQEKIASELEFLRGLFQYMSPLGQELVRRALNQRYQMLPNGVLMVGLHASQVHERLDPRHRAIVPFANAFRNWLDKQITEGADPAENIVDFLLAWDSQDYGGSGRTMPADRLKSHELKFRDGRIYAYYVARGTNPKSRYFMLGDDRAADVLSVRRDTYDSEGGGGTGAANRGGDFIKGDTYVVGKDGRFYSFAGMTIHSEFLSGAAVQAAGIIVAAGGKVQAIDNRSGHYRPSWKNLLQAVELLNNHQVFDGEAVVGLVCSPESTMFFSVADFIRLGTAGFPFVETTSCVRAYQTQYKGRIPVASSKLAYIPPELQQGWHNRAGNNWDRFFQHFYLKGRAERQQDAAQLRPHQDWG